MDNDNTKTAPPPTEGDDHAGVLVLPPYIFGAFLIAALLLEALYGKNLFSWGAQLALGVLLISFGAGLLTWCVLLFQKAGTPLPPDKPTRELVIKGPYTLSRNPIYIALISAFLGLSILLDLLWGFILVIPLIFILQKFVIEREENYLENKFGQSYLSYKNTVRRWL